MEHNELHIINGTDYKEMTKELLTKTELSGHIRRKTKRIGIKPNLVSPSHPSQGATTHPEIVAGIIEYLKEEGYENLVVLEGSWVGDKTIDALDVCGYDKILKAYGVEFIDTQRDKGVICNCRGMELELCESVKTIDFLINVPVMKGHCQTGISCALKNLKGLLPNREKRRFHTMGLHRPIAHLNGGITQDFIVVDNICGDWDFEDGGNPVIMNRIIAGLDPVLCDAYACSLMGICPEEIPYIKMAEELGIGSGDLTKLILRYWGESQEAFQLPKVRKLVSVQDKVEEVESCSACYGYLVPVLDRLRREGILEHLEEKISIGQGYKNKKGTLGIGSCTSCFTHSLKGCPPMQEEMYLFLKTFIEKHF